MMAVGRAAPAFSSGGAAFHDMEWVGGSPSSSKLMDLRAFPDSSDLGSQWKSEVARLEEEIGELRLTAAWALPQLGPMEAEPEPSVEVWPTLPATSEVSSVSPRMEPNTPRGRANCPSSPLAVSCVPALSSPSSLTQQVDVSTHSQASQDSEDNMFLFGNADSTPRGRTRDVKITANTVLANVLNTALPTHQVSACHGACGRRDDAGCAQADAEPLVENVSLREEAEHPREEKVSMEELTQLVRDLETLEGALWHAKQENAALRRDKVTREEAWELALQKLQKENTALREEKVGRDSLESAMQVAQKENTALLEEKLVREERHSRDVAELEGMLEPVMAENSQLRTALHAAEARLSSPRESEPEIERSCDIDRALKR